MAPARPKKERQITQQTHLKPIRNRGSAFECDLTPGPSKRKKARGASPAAGRPTYSRPEEVPALRNRPPLGFVRPLAEPSTPRSGVVAAGPPFHARLRYVDSSP